MLIGDKNRIVIENYISTDEKKFWEPAEGEDGTQYRKYLLDKTK
jgi:hypothetical protein